MKGERRPDATVEALVLGFDIGSDVPMKHAACLGRLEMLGAFEQDEGLAEELDAGSAHQLAEYVGASWCRIVYDDVRYRILHGLETVEESEPQAERLAAYALRPAHLHAAVELGLAGYAAARWFDGAGKIHFRMGDFAKARQSFERAVKIAEHIGLARCRPDLESNLVRARYDENDMAGGATKLRADYEATLDRLLREDGLTRVASGDLPADPSPGTGAGLVCVDDVLNPALSNLRDALASSEGDLRSFTLRRGATVSLRMSAEIPARIQGNAERWRGHCSILHNLSIAYKGKPDPDIERSSIASNRSAAIAWAMSDTYRLAQALNHQAELAEGTDDSRAELLSMAVRALGFQRAARIASQRLARIEGRRKDLVSALDRLRSLFREIDLERKRRGGDLGFDVMSHKYTVDALATVLRANEREESSPLHEEGRKLLQKEESDTVRSVRRLVKVSTYKSAYAKLVYPFFLSRIAARVGATKKGGGHEWMESLSLVEESSSRELLDVIREGSRPKAYGKHDRTKPVEVPADYRVASRASARQGVRRVSPSDDDEVTRELRRQRDAFERDALASPLEPAPHNDEIGFDLRRFTAVHKGVAIIRYFHFGTRKEGDSIIPASLGAYVFRDGAVPSFVELDIPAVDAIFADMDARAARHRESHPRDQWGVPPPTVESAKDLWSALLHPLWEHIAVRKKKESDAGSTEPVKAESRDLQSSLPLVDLPSHLILIPAGDLFRLPLHVALVPDPAGGTSVPLCAFVPLSFSTSATTLVSRGRYLLTEQPIDDTDDLCFLAPRETDLCPDEMTTGLSWKKEHFHVAGAVPRGLDENAITYWGKGDRTGLANLIAEEPEIFVFSGHGLLHAGDLALQLEDGVLSHYAIPSQMRLPRNKLTLLAACVTGQGANQGGGEVSGFLRAFMAAGAGVLGVSLWSVLSHRMAESIHALLDAAAPGEALRTFNAVKALHAHYRAKIVGGEGLKLDVEDCLEACPLVLYL